MYSVIVGCSPQTGQSGSRRSATSVNSVASASNSSSRPTSGSPTPSASFSASFAWSEPTMPGQHAEHAALGARRRELGRRRRREEAAVARALVRLEDRHLALEAVDRAVHDRDPVPDRRVVDEVARREVVGAVDDDVPAVGEDPVDVLGGEPLLVGDHLDVRVQRLDRPLGRLDLRPAERVGRVDDLALEVRRVDDVVVDDAEAADARGGEVERRGRAEAAGADQQHLRVEQLAAGPPRRPRGSAGGASSGCAARGRACAAAASGSRSASSRRSRRRATRRPRSRARSSVFAANAERAPTAQ